MTEEKKAAAEAVDENQEQAAAAENAAETAESAQEPAAEVKDAAKEENAAKEELVKKQKAADKKQTKSEETAEKEKTAAKKPAKKEEPAKDKKIAAEKTAKSDEKTSQEENVKVSDENASTEAAPETVEIVQQPSKPQRRGKKRRIETTEQEKPVSEWEERVVQISRVTKVVKGGKKLSFRAIVIVGNKKGQVGVGCAKASEVIIAIQKAIADGRKNVINVPIFKTTIPHPITGRSGAGSVMLRPASEGTGVIAGGAVRSVLELAGIENILSKSLGSKSPLNAANATMAALKSLRNFNDVARNRGIALRDMLN